MHEIHARTYDGHRKTIRIIIKGGIFYQHHILRMGILDRMTADIEVKVGAS